MAVLSLHAYLGGHTRLIADDFCSAHFARRLGLFRSIWYWYNNWSGRYTAFGVDWLMEKIGVYALPIMPPLVLLAWYVFTFLALRSSMRAYFPGDNATFAALTLGAVFLFAVLSLSPLVLQSVYWWNAMRSYSLPLVLLTLYAVFFQIGTQKLRTKNELLAGSLISFLFLFASGGLGETYVAFQTMLLSMLLIREWFIHKNVKTPQFRFLFAGLAGSVIALLIVVSAPGNTIRQDLYPPHPDLMTLSQVTMQSYLDFVGAIFQTPEKVTGLFGAVFAAFWLGTRSESSAKESRSLFPIVSLGAVLLSIACLVPGVYATSEPSAPRTMIIPVFILIAGLQYVSFMSGQRWTELHGFSNPFGYVIPVLAGLLIGYAALVNGQSLYGDRSVYIEFAQRWQSADAQILQAKARGDESVTIPAMNVWTGPGGDPTDNPKYWVNRCYSLYYGITVLGPNPSTEQP